MSNCSFLAKAKNKFPIQHEELALPFNIWGISAGEQLNRVFKEACLVSVEVTDYFLLVFN